MHDPIWLDFCQDLLGGTVVRQVCLEGLYRFKPQIGSVLNSGNRISSPQALCRAGMAKEATYPCY